MAGGKLAFYYLLQLKQLMLYLNFYVCMQVSSSMALVSDESSVSIVDPKHAQFLAGSLRVVSMAAKFCPGILTPSRLTLLLKILLHPEIKRKKLFVVLKNAAMCLQTVPGVLNSINKKTNDFDGSEAATKALLLSASDGLCQIILGDFLSEDSREVR
jgi:hypothetical protein